jgi:hypothetical protein
MCSFALHDPCQGRRLELTPGEKRDTSTSVAPGERLDFRRQMGPSLIFPQSMSLGSFSMMHEEGSL